MTEEEWLKATDPTPMLEWLARGRPLTTSLADHQPFPNGFRVSDRKLRLLACCCARSLWTRLTVKRCRKAVEVGEQYADGLATVEELNRAGRLAWEAALDARSAEARDHDNRTWRLRRWRSVEEARRLVAWRACAPPRDRAWGIIPNDLSENVSRSEIENGAGLIRCVFGSLPFRLSAVSPSWLTSTVTAIARGVYEERAFGRLPILADALQDAGCDNADLLDHCRGPGPHARGCWAVDLLLGKA